MKPFNLKEALAGKPVVTRDGRKVLKIVNFEEIDQECQPIYAHIEGEDDIETYCVNGNFLYDNDENENDLFMYEEKNKLWIGIRKDAFIYRNDCLHPTTPAFKLKEDVLLYLENYANAYNIHMIEI